MRLFLIRHGQTPSNVSGALDTAYPGAGLTELGLRQARAVPGALAEESPVAIYASRLVRTQLTAAPLAQARGLEVEVRAGLEEITAGDLEMSTETDSAHAYAGCVLDWMRGDLGRRMPGGTDGHEFYDRYSAAVRRIAEQHRPDDTVVIFSHGAAIRAFTALAARLEPEVATELRIGNTGGGVLEGDPASGWRMTRWSSDPLGGPHLADGHAHDVTGESADEALHEA